jgi:rsbT co-antagonist protein RsbR
MMMRASQNSPFSLEAAETFEVLQSAIDAMADEPVFVKDLQHRWIAFNQAFCEFFNQPREAIIGRSDPDFWPPEQARVFWEKDDELFASNQPVFNEEEGTDQNGITHTFYTRKYPIRDPAGRVVGLCGIITDITDMKRRLNEVEQLEIDLAQKAETIEQQRILLQQVSVPVIQVWEHILLLPLVGMIDSYRAGRILENMLEAIARANAQVLILDVTGVPLVDTRVASYLLQGVQAARLLGCESVMVGISPHIAQTIVQLGVDFSHISTKASLQQGLAYALKRLNFTIRRTEG